MVILEKDLCMIVAELNLIADTYAIIGLKEIMHILDYPIQCFIFCINANVRINQ